jgi:hypothetical protein
MHRVASVILFIVVTLIVHDVSFLFLVVLFLVWLFPKKDIGLRRSIRGVRVETLRAHSAHVPHGTLCPLAGAAGCSLQALPGALSMITRKQATLESVTAVLRDPSMMFVLGAITLIEAWVNP